MLARVCQRGQRCEFPGSRSSVASSSLSIVRSEGLACQALRFTTVVVFPSSSSVIGRPSLSAAFINKVLNAYGSPAAGTGQALYDLGVRSGIDDVYPLAFFLHEDEFGKTGWGAVNHSLGNSRCGGWSSCQGGYRFYPTWEAGYQDWYHLILYGYVRGEVTIPIVGHRCSTIEQIVPVYAPASDGNDVSAYIAAMLHAVATWHTGRVWV